MFGIGLTEMLVIGVIALIFIGPDQLPGVARTVGKFINELRRSSDELKGQFRDATNFESVKNDPPPVPHQHQEPEFQPPAPHKGDNLAEMFPDQYGDHTQKADTQPQEGSQAQSATARSDDATPGDKKKG